ncbi:MAG: FHA domain-containing protein [Kiritimatiellae bacterium]|jgi:pSer/pThr/pTyr-binding forkhead associated (FHA) protein|nr:FHA domain-containing protein [Kiritimatiellia bacterium]
MACLVILDGPLKGQKSALDKDITRIGRRDTNDWAVQDESVSGTHCEIEKDDSGYILRDLGSTNGTKVNNEEIKEQRIFRNDILLVGEVPMMLDGDDVPEAADEEPFSLARTTIVIQKNTNKATPKEFTKKTNNNKIWVILIILLLCVIGGLAVMLFKKM